jgi:serine/threonine protein kinase
VGSGCPERALIVFEFLAQAKIRDKESQCPRNSTASYPELVQTGLDMPDVLRQITQGVRYLHSLKIVHLEANIQEPGGLLTAKVSDHVMMVITFL